MELNAGSPARIQLVPDIEEGVPLPASVADAMPVLSQDEELRMRASTVKLISDLVGVPIVPTDKDMAKAEQIAKEHMANPASKLDLSKETNELQIYLAGLVARTNFQLVDELSELKTYVINKLVYEIEHAGDSKTRIAAVTKLGEVDGVDAFKKRTETTIKIQTMEEVENELLSLLDVVEGKYIDVEAKEVVRKELDDA